MMTCVLEWSITSSSFKSWNVAIHGKLPRSTRVLLVNTHFYMLCLCVFIYGNKAISDNHHDDKMCDQTCAKKLALDFERMLTWYFYFCYKGLLTHELGKTCMDSAFSHQNNPLDGQWMTQWLEKAILMISTTKDRFTQLLNVKLYIWSMALITLDFV